jgi:MFS family permease
LHISWGNDSIDIPRETSGWVAMALRLMTIAGRLSFGWFGDRFDKRRVTAMGMALLGLSMIMFNLVALCWWLVSQKNGRTHSDRQVGAPFLAVSAIYQTPIQVALD